MKFQGTRIHFVGIGGISMSALAALLLQRGATVSGSDLMGNDQTAALAARGIRVFFGHRAENILAPDYVIINGAIDDTNPEVTRARELAIPIIGREELLAEIEKPYKNRLAVAGAHGKSTTTAMLGEIFVAAGLNPTVHNGAAMLPAYNNLILGSDDYFITEACEFKRSFLRLKPSVAVVTNIDADHLDCYQNLNDIKAAFRRFCANSAAVIINGDCKNCKELTGTRFGTSRICDIRAVNISEHKRGKYAFDVIIKKKQESFQIKLSVAGKHNVMNALAAVAVALHFEIAPNIIAHALNSFRGTARRFETLGKIGSCSVITDYAHHPTEIATTIATAKSLYNRFLLVFQPHTYTRTLALFNEFTEVLKTCDCVLYKTYAAREKPISGGTARDLARAVASPYFACPETLRAFLLARTARYNAIILTGAGDINQINLQPEKNN